MTLLDKMVSLIQALQIKLPCYFVADAYYATGSVVKGLLKQNNHLITRVKPNAVAYEVARPKAGKKVAGRRKLYGTKLHLAKLFTRQPEQYQQALSPVYGESNVTLNYVSVQMLWRPVGIVVMFVAVIHPNRGKFLLMCTDLTLSPLDVIMLYGLRFKIEVSFKQAIYTIGAYSYHFWMRDMRKTKQGDGDWDVSTNDEKFQRKIARKLSAYHAHIQLGVIAQGLMQYLAMSYSQDIWKYFGSWLRTIRPNIPASEFVVRLAMRNTLPEFLMGKSNYTSLQKFWQDHLDFERLERSRFAA